MVFLQVPRLNMQIPTRAGALGTAFFYNLKRVAVNASSRIEQIIPVLNQVINWFTRLFNIVGPGNEPALWNQCQHG